MSSQGGVGRREVAWRIFAAEYDGSSLEHSDSDEERAPNYVVTPTGARINRLFVVGVLTEIEQVGDEVLRARIVDPTGGFVVYAGQYQPDALAFLERAEAPMFVAVTGKARTFQPDDSDLVYTSIRPESMNAVDAETRDRWTVQTAQQTLDRVRTFAGALDSGQRGEDLRQALEAADVDTGLAAGVPLALDHYRTSTPYLAELQDVALDAARVVAGEQDEVGTVDASPDEPGDATLDVDVSLETPDVETEAGTETEPATEFDAEPSNSETTESAEAESTFESGSESEAESTFESEPAAESESAVGSEPAAGGESTTEAESEFDAGTVSESETATERESATEPESATETTAPDVDPEPETPPAQAREPDEFEEPAEPEPTDAELADSEPGEGEPIGETGVEEFDTGSESADDSTDELGDFDSGTSEDDLGDFDDQPMGEDVSGEMYELTRVNANRSRRSSARSSPAVRKSTRPVRPTSKRRNQPRRWRRNRNPNRIPTPPPNRRKRPGRRPGRHSPNRLKRPNRNRHRPKERNQNPNRRNPNPSPKRRTRMARNPRPRTSKTP